ncbi:hypothetical protein DSM3645_03113 [Blastopirellula marina DSM 3645]|uniref:Uncharacterized protein n=1 Tax=Blastopirellula marina DSM 3645 TaxID=314230 RepID=A3ZVT6_9BACT|nr:hypothetical protein DSM3645_03113 [Blastopirellula marina DSM 3645]
MATLFYCIVHCVHRWKQPPKLF